jgi:predicted enzyme related to lactoylglutathione lyase
MSDQAKSNVARIGAVLYVVDVERTALFYATLLAMARLHAEADYAVLADDDFELVIHAIPAQYAADIVIATPPEPREDAPIKLSWTVESLDRCAEHAVRTGGRLFEGAWSWRGFRIRNGCDPEGNIFQLREIER